MVESLQKALDNAGPTFGGIAKTLEDATKISGIKVIVNYTYNGETMATQTFDSSAAAESGGSQPDESEEEEASDEEAETESADDAS